MRSIRLSRQDWIDAGQAILREQGIAGVKLRPLLDRLEVTTGSFYHHFKDIGEYLDALADHYGGENVDRVLATAEGVHGAARLAEMYRLAEVWDIAPLDRAMRIWATSSDRAAAAVRRLDHAFLETMFDAMLELGFDDDEARARSLLAYSAGAGNTLVFSPWPEDPADIALALKIVTTPLP